MTTPLPVGKDKEKPLPYSGTAFVSLLSGLSALVFFSLVPVLSVLTAAGAVAAGLAARRALKANPEIRGFGTSLAGFLLGAGVLCVKFLPAVIGWVIIMLNAAGR